MNKKRYKQTVFQLILLVLILVFQTGNAYSENRRNLVNLKGNWKFSIGDDPAWASPTYDDSDWEKVFVPNSWERNGFEGYNGFAWYRKSFQISLPFNQAYLYLDMGHVDDVDEVYINGVFVGASGNFPPLVETAYDVPRMYPIPAELIHKSGQNLIAVRVYDEYHEGGIMSGELGIFVDIDQEKMEVDLTGYWDFESACDIDKGNLKLETYREGKIFVPGFWEARGYNGCDGQAKYSKKFEYSSQLLNSDKALVLGVIDDRDEVYLNGNRLEWIKSKSHRLRRYNQSNHLSFRVYPIPSNLFFRGGTNVLEVFVNDHGGPGGIYRGPIGIASRGIAETILNKENKEKRSDWERFFDYWLD